jgi:hypothetical protein
MKGCIFVIHVWLLIKYYLHCSWQHDWREFHEAMGLSRLMGKWIVEQFGEGWEKEVGSPGSPKDWEFSCRKYPTSGVKEIVITDTESLNDGP